MFLVPKKDSKQRSVINFKRLNQSVKAEHFKMECLKNRAGDWMAKIYLKDAYLIPIAQKVSSRSNGRTRHTIGWFSASWFFTNTTRSVGAALQVIRLHLIIFIDELFRHGGDWVSPERSHLSNCISLYIYIFVINHPNQCSLPHKKSNFLEQFLAQWS